MDKDEAEIARVKYKSKRFCEMDFTELDTWVKALLLKIHTITGWVVPEDNMLKIFVDQFRKNVLETYSNCNPDEVEYAFRTFGTGVKDWGKQMNLSLIDQVMTPYLSRRYDVSKHEEIIHIRNASLQIENKEDMSKEAMESWFDETVKKVKAGTIKVDFIPLMLYEWMDANGNISATNAEKYGALERAANYRKCQLQEEYEKNPSQSNQWRLSNFVSQKLRGYFEGEEVDKVKSLAKKILLFEKILVS